MRWKLLEGEVCCGICSSEQVMAVAFRGGWTSLCHHPSPQLPQQPSIPEHPWPLAPAESCRLTWTGHLHSHSEWQQSQSCHGSLLSSVSFPGAVLRKWHFSVAVVAKGSELWFGLCLATGYRQHVLNRPFRRDRRQPQQQSYEKHKNRFPVHYPEHSLPSSCPLARHTALSGVSRLGGVSHH